MRIVTFALAACCPVLAAQAQPSLSSADSTVIISLGTGAEILANIRRAYHGQVVIAEDLQRF